MHRYKVLYQYFRIERTGHYYFLPLQDMPSYFLVFHIEHTIILFLFSFERTAMSNFTKSELHHRADFLNVRKCLMTFLSQPHHKVSTNYCSLCNFYFNMLVAIFYLGTFPVFHKYLSIAFFWKHCISDIANFCGKSEEKVFFMIIFPIAFVLLKLTIP